MNGSGIENLKDYLAKIPGVEGSIGTGHENGQWWLKFTIDVDHPQAWNVVQELGFVLNYLSVNDRLPTVFKPVSPPPYLNGAAREFLSWVIECHDTDFLPKMCLEILENRLPKPVEDLSQWPSDGDS